MCPSSLYRFDSSSLLYSPVYVEWGLVVNEYLCTISMFMRHAYVCVCMCVCVYIYIYIFFFLIWIQTMWLSFHLHCLAQCQPVGKKDVSSLFHCTKYFSIIVPITQVFVNYSGSLVNCQLYRTGTMPYLSFYSQYFWGTWQFIDVQ